MEYVQRLENLEAVVVSQPCAGGYPSPSSECTSSFRYARFQ